MCRCRGYSGRRGRSIRHHLPSGLSIASRPRCGAACRSDSRILWVRFSPAKFPRSPMSRRYRSRWPKSVTCVALTIALACTSDERVESPPRNITSTTTTTTPSQVLVGAGNIANCGTLNDDATAALIDNIAGTVYTTGDNIYGDGSLTDFQNCYGPSWGRHKARTRPAVGHKDYQAAGSAQEQWLKADLAASAKQCTVAIWDQPRFSSSGTNVRSAVKPLWDDLYAAGAELVLNAHYRVYERFAPQTPAGVADATNGIRQFTVGT